MDEKIDNAAYDIVKGINWGCGCCYYATDQELNEVKEVLEQHFKEQNEQDS